MDEIKGYLVFERQNKGRKEKIPVFLKSLNLRTVQSITQKNNQKQGKVMTKL